MKQEFSLAQLTILNASPVEMATIAFETGYDYFSMRQIYMGLPEEPDFDLSKNKRLFSETKLVMADTGIRLLDVELARIVENIDPSSYEPAFATCAELGGKSVLSSIWTDKKAVQLEHFAKVCDLAKQYDLTVELEYVPIASVKNLTAALNVLSLVNRSNAGILIDIHHFHRAGDTVEELARIPKDLFHMLHLCDAPVKIPSDPEEMRRIMREARDYPGEGGIDINSILSAIPSVPYSIELPKKSVSDKFGYREHAKRCLETSKKYLAPFQS
jgi:sugar phosphate isomerase/epimerase